MKRTTLRRALSTHEAAEYCGISESLLKQARMTSGRKRDIDAPPATKLSTRKVVYLLEDLDEWLDAHKSADRTEAAA